MCCPAITRSYGRLELELNAIRTEEIMTLRTLQLQMPPSFGLHPAMPSLHDFRRVSREVEINLLTPNGVEAVDARGTRTRAIGCSCPYSLKRSSAVLKVLPVVRAVGGGPRLSLVSQPGPTVVGSILTGPFGVIRISWPNPHFYFSP